nr:hypothetical protein [Tanacetum cinerariifolium]
SDDNKGVSKEGPSITIAKKPIPKVIFKSPIPIKGCVIGLANVGTWDNIVKKFRMRTPERCADKSKGKRKNHLVEIQADDHDLLVNSDNENDDMLGYEFEKYSDAENTDETNHTEDADGTNHSDMKLVKRGITKLYKFRMEYGKPGGIKIKEKSARGKMARSKNVYHHKMRRGRYVFVKEKMIKNKEIKADEEPPHGIMWLKGRVNKDEEFLDDEIRSLRDKLKEADDKIKEGTLNLDDGIDAMTVVFGKEKGGYARGVTPMGTYEVDRTQSSVVVRNKDARIRKKSNGLVTSEKAYKCKPWHLKKSNIVALGTVYKSDGKCMLHNQALLNDCYKVSIDSSLVNAACIPDVGNNGLKTVKDYVGGFFSWPKNQVVLDEEVTPPTTIQKISVTILHQNYNQSAKLCLS